MKKILYPLVFFLISQVLLSCGDGCGCKKKENFVDSHFDIQGIKAGFTDQPDNGYSWDTSSRNISVTADSAVINADNAGIVILYNIRYTAINRFPTFSLISTAYACSPISAGENGSLEQVDSFYVIPAGRLGNDSVNTDTIFTLSHTPYVFINVNGVIETWGLIVYENAFKIDQDHFYPLATKIYFKLNNNFKRLFVPTGYMRYKVVIKLKNGERYEDTTEYIKLI